MPGRDARAPALCSRVRHHVALVPRNRTGGHPAINAEMADPIEGHVATVESDPAIRVAIIAARGKSFCAGADLKEINAGNAAGLATARGGFAGVVQRERTKPAIAAVGGPAPGGGTETGLASHPAVGCAPSHLRSPGGTGARGMTDHGPC